MSKGRIIVISILMFIVTVIFLRIHTLNVETARNSFQTYEGTLVDYKIMSGGYGESGVTQFTFESGKILTFKGQIFVLNIEFGTRYRISWWQSSSWIQDYDVLVEWLD